MALGFMTKHEALSEGFTHHGSYYGIPLWMTETDEPMICPKHILLEPVMDLFIAIEMFLFPLVHGEDADPVFRFVIKSKIEVDDARTG